MDKSEWRAIMQSDSKVWELAEKRLTKEGMELTMRDMPWGIGDAVVIMEVKNDGRPTIGAFSGYGAYIRGLIDECINDEAIEARATQDAAFAREDSDQRAVDDAGRDNNTGGVGGVPQEVSEVANKETVPLFSVPSTHDTDPATRLSELRDAVDQCRAYISVTTREIEALEAYEAVMAIAPGGTAAKAPGDDAADAAQMQTAPAREPSDE